MRRRRNRSGGNDHRVPNPIKENLIMQFNNISTTKKLIKKIWENENCYICFFKYTKKVIPLQFPCCTQLVCTRCSFKLDQCPFCRLNLFSESSKNRKGDIHPLLLEEKYKFPKLSHLNAPSWTYGNLNDSYLQTNFPSDLNRVSIIVRVRREKYKKRTKMLINESENSICYERMVTNYVQQEQKQKINFSFDRVFGVRSKQEEVFKEVGDKLISLLVNGLNSVCFAYGQTGSGKTYTMIGNKNEENHLGLIPRVAHKLLAVLQACRRNQWKLKLSFVEIYKERTADLLNIRKEYYRKSVYETKNGEVRIRGVRRYEVDEYSQLLYLLNLGMKNRTTKSTIMNKVSSRSHAVFIVYLEQNKGSSSEKKMESRLYLVDLAGSEKSGANFLKNVRKAGKQMEREILREGISINSSLFHLGRCITKMSAGSSSLNLRDTALTWLLKDALNLKGKAKTFMISCISPSPKNSEESLSTLRYTCVAKKIKTKKVKRNKVESMNDISLRSFFLEAVNIIRDLPKIKEKYQHNCSKLMGLDDQMKDIEEQFNYELKEMRKIKKAKDAMLPKTKKVSKRIGRRLIKRDEEQLLYDEYCRSKKINQEKRRRAALKKHSSGNSFRRAVGDLRHLVTQICSHLKVLQRDKSQSDAERIYELELSSICEKFLNIEPVKILVTMIERRTDIATNFLTVNVPQMARKIDNLLNINDESGNLPAIRRNTGFKPLRGKTLYM